MPPVSLPSTRCSLTSRARTSNVPTKRTPKLASVAPNSEEGFYLLATYCFDLTRKMKYLFDATKDFGAFADPAFKARAFQATDAINSPNLNVFGNREPSWLRNSCNERQTRQPMQRYCARRHAVIRREERFPPKPE